jgi:HEAT repeat protein
MPLIRKDPAAQRAAEQAGAVDPFALLKTGDASARWSAARSLATMPAGVEAIAEALAEERDAHVREAMFTALARAATPRSAAIVAPFVGSDDAAVRTLAIDALKAMPEAAVTTLGALLGDPDPDVRLLSCEIARAVRSGKATRQLCQLLEHETEANVCGAAIEVLAEIGDKSAAPALALCAARFPDDPFLAFAIKVAGEQLGVGSTTLRD